MSTPPFFWPLTGISFPGAGGNAQSIMDSWFSTSITYAGDAQVESRIVSDVASYGKQLGILSEALLELAGPGAHGPAVERLACFVKRIDEVKARHAKRLDERTAESFEKLAEESPRDAERLLADLARKLEAIKAREKPCAKEIEA